MTRVENFEHDAGFLTASKASAVPLKKRRTRTYRPVAHEAFGALRSQLVLVCVAWKMEWVNTSLVFDVPARSV